MTNMGIEPFLLSTSLTAVLAQRLVRRICPDCKTAYTPEKRLIKELELPEGTKLYKGEGCLVCRKTGYRGRLGLFELLTVNEEIRKLIINHATGSEIQTAAQKNGMKTLFEDGVDKALSGQTTMEEVFRVTRLKE
jgi:type II secretory ATPase GspE/PulE/Tfp pilus assembly ATPase PilB-like protein